MAREPHDLESLPLRDISRQIPLVNAYELDLAVAHGDHEIGMSTPRKQVREHSA
jgi:hypothetical protein